MNSKILSVLEFNKIKAQLLPYTSTEMGQQLVTSLLPSADRQLVAQRLAQTADGVLLWRYNQPLPLPHLQDLKVILHRLEIGGILNGSELAAISKQLRSVHEVVRFFKDLTLAEPLPKVTLLVDDLIVLPDIIKVLRRQLSDEGTLYDDATPELARLRRQIKQQETALRDRMTQYLHGSMAKYLSETLVTIRNDRYVLPVKQEYRKKFGGMIHDQSASGQTLYIEPQVMLDANDQLQHTLVEEKQEIARIYQQLSALLQPYTHEFSHNQVILGQLDLINAKARLADAMAAVQPHLSSKQEVSLYEARHPLLDPTQVVANDIVLGQNYRTIIITGPNTGGKTISLKTLGILQVMVQSGLFIPVKEGSTATVFHEIFADIGDEQSIEQNLSTFSAHMTNIITIIRQVTAHDLVLLDELGAGTDPQEGASLAIAMLDEFQRSQALILATTHYPELKLYAYEHDATINASMEFDIATLQPTYRLMIGVPGRSNAFDIAQRLGLPQPIVQQARDFINGDSQRLNNMIGDLEQQRRLAEEQTHSLAAELAEATQLHQDLAQGVQQFEQQRQQQLELAQAKANQLVEQAQQQADQIIAQLRSYDHDHQVKDDRLIAAKSALNALKVEPNLTPQPVKAKQTHVFQQGDEVRIPAYHADGLITQVFDAHTFEVQMGTIKMKLKATQLEPIKKKKSVSRPIVQVKRHTATVPMQLDLRGERYEVAMADTERYLDAALLSGYAQVTIVHGKGTGAIRQGVQELLARMPRVKKFTYAPANAGGNGATIVTFS